jgi:hypothetical protein
LELGRVADWLNIPQPWLVLQTQINCSRIESKLSCFSKTLHICFAVFHHIKSKPDTDGKYLGQIVPRCTSDNDIIITSSWITSSRRRTFSFLFVGRKRLAGGGPIFEE